MKTDRRQKTEDGRQKSGGLSSVIPAAQTCVARRRGRCPLFFAASAVMLTVIQPPFSLSFLAWVSLVPFILACSPQAKIRPLIIISFLVSLFYWLGNLYWVSFVTLLGWFAFCLYTAVLWPMLAVSVRYCRARKLPLFIAVPVLFVGAERLQGLFLGGFFWRFLAHSQYANIPIIQIADIFGAAGVSFLVAMVNGLVAELILDAHSRKSIFKISNFLKAAFVCAALVATFAYGKWRIEQSDKFIEPGPLVASVQSNVPQTVKETFQSEELIFDELLKLSSASAQAGAELVVWPETMIQAILQPRVLKLIDSNHLYNIFDKALREHSKGSAYLLVGAYSASPEITEDFTIRFAARYNSAYLYKPDGQQSDILYNKIHLVPFGEVMPFKKSAPWLFKLLMKLTPFDFDYSLDPGEEYTVFEMPTERSAPSVSNGLKEDRVPSIEYRVYKFSVMICYEDAVPAIGRRFALDRKGTKRLDWLVNISNDGWFVRFKQAPDGSQIDAQVLPSTELAQHTAVCVFRAVENRLAVLRSVNTGISCLIDSVGRIRNSYVAGGSDFPAKAMQRQGVAGWFVDKMPIDKRTTFFSRYGQWLDFCCAFCLVLLIIIQVLESFYCHTRRPDLRRETQGQEREECNVHR